MGLISRWFEARDVPTVSVYLQESMAEAVPAPRMLLLRWPFGHPYGEPHRPALQAMVLRRALRWAGRARSFGDRDDPDWPWRRTDVSLPEAWRDSLEPLSPDS